MESYESEGIVLAWVIIALMALATGVVVLTVATVKYLFSARLRNLAIACEKIAPDPKKRAEMTERLQLITFGLVQRADAPFANKYISTNKLHRILYMIGGITAQVATVFWGLLVLWELVDKQVPTLAADFVLELNHGFRYAVLDMIMNLVMVIGASFGFVFILGLVLYLWRRFRCVQLIHRGRHVEAEPKPVDKRDLAMVCIGIFVPLSLIIILLSTFYYQQKHEEYELTITRMYQEVLETPSVQGYLFSEPDSEYIKNLIKREYGELLGLSKARRKLIIGTVVEHFLRVGQLGEVGGAEDARKVALVLTSIDEALTIEILANEYYQSFDRYTLLLEAF